VSGPSPGLQRLLEKKYIPRSQLSDRDVALMRPLFDGNVVVLENSGRGQTVRVVDDQALKKWLLRHYPSLDGAWTSPLGAYRAGAVASNRDSKAGGPGVDHSILHLRAMISGAAMVRVNGVEVPVPDLTARFGLAACLVGEGTKLEFEGRVAIIENLECFLRAELLVSDLAVALNSAGRISDRLISRLAAADFGTKTLYHLPDYDPAGLGDYLRLKKALADRVELWVPTDLELRFSTFGNRSLIANKPRNRELLEQLSTVSWPCSTSARVFRLIRETGSGLEQESLLLRPKEYISV
jgi:hypothetical protein